MPLKPKYNFSEGVLQKLAQFATKQISEGDMITWLYNEGIENPEHFLKERERLLSAIASIIEHYQKGDTTDDRPALDITGLL